MRQGCVLRALLGLALGACASEGRDCRPVRLAVLTAMPSELAPLVERARIDESVVIEGHTFRVGELGGVPVVLGLTWIGMENASATARAVLQRFQVTGVVVSGVAYSHLRIGDVAVPELWAEPDGTRHSSHPQWLALAGSLEGPGAVHLEKCTIPPLWISRDRTPDLVRELCLASEPAVVVGGTGHSGDGFNGKAYGCDPDGGAVYGCDIAPASALSGTGDPPPVPEGTTRGSEGPLPYVKDMETAAIAREARARDLPFLAFRSASDGSQDPLGLTEPFAQFFVYYDLASRNAAAATIAFLERVAASDACAADAGA
jgi:nucleoside phosphorylase